MARTLEDVLHDALQLQVEERGQLIEFLHDSLMTYEEREVEQAWFEESERRYGEWKAGRARSLPGDEVLANLRRKYGRDNAVNRRVLV